MIKTFVLPAIMALGLALPGVALACGDPSEQWYASVSDVVFDGAARCDAVARTCQIRVSHIVKNPLHLGIEGRSLDVDFQNWYAEQFQREPDEIIIICGVPVFEPEENQFRARFYADLDEATSELIIRTYRPRKQNSASELSEAMP